MLFRLHRPDLPHLPRLRATPRLLRPFAKGARKHTVGVALGVAIMLLGTHIAHWRVGVSPAIWDAMAWSIHAFGACPLMAHAEAFWKIVAGKP